MEERVTKRAPKILRSLRTVLTTVAEGAAPTLLTDIGRPRASRLEAFRRPAATSSWSARPGSSRLILSCRALDRPHVPRLQFGSGSRCPVLEVHDDALERGAGGQTGGVSGGRRCARTLVPRLLV